MTKLEKYLLATTCAIFALVSFGIYRHYHTKSFGTIPNTPAQFETSLSVPQGTADTTMTLASAVLGNGATLSGYYCFTVDSNTALSEYECGTASTTSPTLITGLTRGVDPQYGTTSIPSLIYSHRVGADVRITDFPVVQQLSNIFNGTQGITNPILYSGVATSTLQTNLNYLASVGYVNSTAFGSTVIYSLNGLTSSVQTFATTTGGSLWTITSSGSVHTWNIPASPTFTGTSTLSGALLIPVASATALGTSGQISVNTLSNSFSWNSGGAQYYDNAEHLIEPFYIENPATSTDANDPIYIANATTTITKILCVNKGANDNATFNFVWDNSNQTATSSAASKLFTSPTTCNATTSPVSLTITGSSTINTLQILKATFTSASTSGITISIYGKYNQ